MLVILPVTLYLLFAAVVLALRRTKIKSGITWFIAAFAALAVWGVILAYHWVKPNAFTMSNWIDFTGNSKDLVLILDQYSWQYAFTLTALTLGVVLTAPARMQHHTESWAWAGGLAVTAAGLLAILAGNPTTLVLAWTALDAIEITFYLLVMRSEFNLRMVVSFGARLLGTILVMWAMTYSHSQGRSLTLTGVTPQEGLYFLLAIGLRIGVFPFYLPFTTTMPVRRGVGTILRMASPLTSMVLLGRLVDLVMPTEWAVILSIFTALAALYGSTMWLLAKDVLRGRPYWLIAFAGMAFTCVVRGKTEASFAWGVAMVLNGAIIFIASDLIHNRRLLFIPLLSFVALSGLPFTPTATGWDGLVVLPFSGLDVIFVLAYAILLLGFMRHMFEPGEKYPEGERWIQVVFIVGLMLVIFTEWLIEILEQVYRTSGVWWAGVISFTLAMIGFAIYFRIPRDWLARQRSLQWIAWIVNKVTPPMAKFFSFDWLYRIIWELLKIGGKIGSGLAVIFEGEGGVLWSLLLFILLIFLINIGGG